MEIHNFGTRVVIIGGTPSGIACAVRCAREGLDVTLVSFYPVLGGIMSSGLGVTDQVFGGFRAPIHEEFMHRVRGYYLAKYGEESKQYEACFKRGKLHVEPHVAMLAFTEMVQQESRIKVLNRYYPASVERTERRLTAVTVHSFDGAPPIRLEGESFVDASYEGDLAAAAGAVLRTGREGRNEYGEPHAGKLFVFPDGKSIAPEALEGLLELPSVPEFKERIFVDASGEGDEAFQAYNFRVCLTCDPANRVYPSKPATYDRSMYLGLVQKPEEQIDTIFVLRSHLMLSEGSWSLRSHLPNDKLTWNDPLLLGAYMEYPNGSWARRAEIVQQHADFALGMLYFLQNDEAVRPEVRQEALRWGLPRDEFADNGHFPYEILVREGRRLVGRYVFTEHDGVLVPGIQRAPIHADSIGIADWPISSHDCTADRRPGSLNDGVMNLTSLTKAAQIPYRTLLPDHLDNLLVTVCMSCTHVGWGMLRLEPVFMHLGECAAFAITLAASSGIMPACLDPELLVRKLVESQVMVSYFKDFDMSSEADWVAAVQYFGTKGLFCNYEARPELPLGSATARIWVDSFARGIAGEWNPIDTAKRLAAAVQMADEEPVQRCDFLRWIEEATGGSCVTKLNHSESEMNGPLSRGEACKIMYDHCGKRYDAGRNPQT